MRTWLCTLIVLNLFSLHAQEKPQQKSIEQVPIRRIIIYKDGHCLTEREVKVNPTENPLRIVNATNALLGGVWAVSRHKTISLSGLYARMVDEKRSLAPANLAELLMLNEGKRVRLTLMFPNPSEQEKTVQTEQYEGTLRVFKPSLRYEDAYPTADAPPEYTPPPTTPIRRPDNYYPYSFYYPQHTPQQTPDYVQDLFSRTAAQANFAIETDRRMVFFNPAQVKQIEFLETPALEREVIVKRPVLELTLSGGRSREQVPVTLYSLEKGVRWIPEYLLFLPTEHASEGELVLAGTIINELEDLHQVDAAVVVGFTQFMMEQLPSPLSLRETFRRFSRWFEDDLFETPRYMYAAPRVADFLGFGGFSASEGAVAPSIPSGMGLEIQSAGNNTGEPIALLRLPKLTLPKNSSVRVELSRQKLPVERTFLWTHDMSKSEYQDSYYYSRRQQNPTTLEDLAFQIARERRFSNEVYEALALKNTTDTPWTISPIVVLRDDAPLTQDMMLFTPPGEEAYIPITLATRLSISCMVQQESDQPQSGFDGRSSMQRALIRVHNFYETPARLTVRIRFVGHFKEASQTPSRVSSKTIRDMLSLGWYERQLLRLNPYTELVWKVEVPPGTSEWWFRYERRTTP
ncbi:hypothetical protein HRbin15_01544 [bacterium HR15]|nr:hypothetical protein HRbin15_01544 [bacterium HR15]